MEDATIIGQEKGIDAIGFGELAAGAGKVARQAGIDDADGDAGLVQGSDEGLVVRPGGFADDVDGLGTFNKALAQESKAGGVIGNGGRELHAGTTQIDGEFGDIGAEVDRRGEHG